MQTLNHVLLWPWFLVRVTNLSHSSVLLAWNLTESVTAYGVAHSLENATEKIGGDCTVIDETASCFLALKEDTNYEFEVLKSANSIWDTE